MWIVIFLGGWLIVSLIASPVIGHFVLTHLKINDDAEAHDISARDVELERQAPKVAVLEQRRVNARMTLN
jgi:hypothetical protein